MGQVGTDKDKVSVPEIGNMAADLAFARPPVHIHQLQFRMVVPAIVLVLVVFIELLKSERVAKTRGYCFKSRFLGHVCQILFGTIKVYRCWSNTCLQNYQKYMLFYH